MHHRWLASVRLPKILPTSAPERQWLTGSCTLDRSNHRKRNEGD
jgi:hypothetical protein